MSKEDDKLRYTPHTVLKIGILQCRAISGQSFWEKIWGGGEYYVHVRCDNAQGPQDLHTKKFKRSSAVCIEEVFQFTIADESRKSFNAALKIAVCKKAGDCDQHVIELSNFHYNDKQEYSMKFTKQKIQLDFEIEKIFRSSPDFRFSLNLSNSEIETLRKRKLLVLKQMQKILSGEGKPKHVDEVPTISVICSGGGFRSVIQCCGAMEVLKEEGILDMTSYVCGLSGGAWYLLTAYAKKAMDNMRDLSQLHTDIRASIKSNMIFNTLIDLGHYLKYRKYRAIKDKEGQPVSFVDFYGFTIGRSLLGSAIDGKISDLQPYIETGNVPLPIVTAIHARSKVSTANFHADLEITPWEMSFPNYAINLLPQTFGSLWYRGNLIKKCAEFPVHYMYGVTSSAFGIQLKYLLQGETTEADDGFIGSVRKHKFSRRRTRRKRQRSFHSSISRYSHSDHSRSSAGSLYTRKTSRRNSNNSHSSRKSSVRPLSDVFCEDEKPRVSRYKISSATQRNSLVPTLQDSEDYFTSVLQRRESLYLENVMENESQQDSSFRKLMKSISHHPLFSDREAVFDRTAKIFNVALGFNDAQYFPLNPSHKPEDPSGMDNSISTEDKILSLVDAALVCNVPINAVLRSERKSDFLIICDATEYTSDTDFDYLEIFLAERAARAHGLKFPKIDLQELKDDPRGEMHVFEDKTDPECPTVIWLTLSNKEYKKFTDVKQPESRPGDKDRYKLTNDEKFNEFSVYGVKSEYATMKTQYTPLQFDRLRELMKFNIKRNIKEIKYRISKKVLQKRKQLESKSVDTKTEQNDIWTN